jgi:hypothetical protein
VTTRDAPPIEAGWAAIAIELMQKQSGIFLRAGLDDPNQLERIYEIDLYAYAISHTFRPWRTMRGSENAQTDLPDGQIDGGTCSGIRLLEVRGSQQRPRIGGSQ